MTVALRLRGKPNLGESRLADRLARYAALAAGERAALERLEEQERTCRRGSVLIAENEVPRELFVVREGWLHSSVGLGNGTRQIMRFHFGGDLVGLPLLAFAESPESVTAVTDARVSAVPRDRFTALVAEHPRLAGLLLAMGAAERVWVGDRLASIGRTPARARVASLLCELFARVRAADGHNGNAMQVPLTQEDIGDATGLTAVHVNRMMRRLVEDGIIERNGNHVRVLDEPRLCAEAAFVDRSELVLDWLPPARD